MQPIQSLILVCKSVLFGQFVLRPFGFARWKSKFTLNVIDGQIQFHMCEAFVPTQRHPRSIVLVEHYEWPAFLLSRSLCLHIDISPHLQEWHQAVEIQQMRKKHSLADDLLIVIDNHRLTSLTGILTGISKNKHCQCPKIGPSFKLMLCTPMSDQCWSQKPQNLSEDGDNRYVFWSAKRALRIEQWETQKTVQKSPYMECVNVFDDFAASHNEKVRFKCLQSINRGKGLRIPHSQRRAGSVMECYKKFKRTFQG